LVNNVESLISKENTKWSKSIKNREEGKKGWRSRGFLEMIQTLLIPSGFGETSPSLGIWRREGISWSKRCWISIRASHQIRKFSFYSFRFATADWNFIFMVCVSQTIFVLICDDKYWACIFSSRSHRIRVIANFH
jgi:hypothetical protein